GGAVGGVESERDERGSDRQRPRRRRSGRAGKAGAGDGRRRLQDARLQGGGEGDAELPTGPADADSSLRGGEVTRIVAGCHAFGYLLRSIWCTGSPPESMKRGGDQGSVRLHAFGMESVCGDGPRGLPESMAPRLAAGG